MIHHLDLLKTVLLHSGPVLKDELLCQADSQDDPILVPGSATCAGVAIVFAASVLLS